MLIIFILYITIIFWILIYRFTVASLYGRFALRSLRFTVASLYGRFAFGSTFEKGG